MSENEDIERFVAMLEEKIKNKEIKKYANFDKTKNNVKLLPDESEEVAKQQEEEYKLLSQNILAKFEKRQGGLLASLMQKFGDGGNGNEYDIDEEAFQNIQNNRKKRGSNPDDNVAKAGRKKTKK